jgi:hypothetical protein
MEGRLALGLVALVAAAGCLGGTALEPEEAPVPPPLAFLADEEGIRPAPTMPGVTFSAVEGGVSATFDFMAMAEPDLATLWLYQASANQSIHAESDMSVLVDARGVPGAEAGGQQDFCLFNMAEVYPPGDAYLGRALGDEAPLPEQDPLADDRRYHWSLGSGKPGILVVSIGIGQSSSIDAPLGAGQWFLVAFAESGIDYTDLNDGENSWGMTFESDGPGRFIRIPSTPFLCGVGFARSGGVGDELAYSGGRMDAQGRYGTTAAFGATALPLQLTTNEATMLYRGEEIPLGDASHEWRTSYAPEASSIQVAQWVGDPRWLLAGLSIPVPAPGCPPGCPFADPIARERG